MSARPCEDAILDVREARAFATGHLPGSGHLPEHDWEERRSELPPRDHPVLVVAETPERSREAAARLEAMGYTRVRALDRDVETVPEARDTSAAAALWRPTPALVRMMERFGSLIQAGPVADLASGSGRDAVWLAMRGFEVEAWDRATEALARARALALISGVSLRTVECDLERQRPPLPAQRYALLTCFRFLHRPLFASIEKALAPGGLLIYETFRIGQERFGRPTHAQFLLESGELPAAFAALEILHHEESAPEASAVTACVVARRA